MTNPTPEDKAVALAEKHFGSYAHEARNLFIAMLAERDKQHTEELEQVREQTRREVLEEAERHVSDLPVNKLRCSELQLTEQAWEEALEFAAREIRSLK